MGDGPGGAHLSLPLPPPQLPHPSDPQGWAVGGRGPSAVGRGEATTVKWTRAPESRGLDKRTAAHKGSLLNKRCPVDQVSPWEGNTDLDPRFTSKTKISLKWI